MKYIGIYKALYHYTAQSNDELNLNENDTLYILDNNDSDWWKAQAKPTLTDPIGPIGLVPSNYVSEAEPIGAVKALYDYAGQSDEELTFKENDVMVLYENDDSDWFYVKSKDGLVGLVPSNYVELVEHEHTSQQAEAASEHAPFNEKQITVPAGNQSSASAFSTGSSASPKPQRLMTDQDDALSWPVHEYDVEKKKKRKSKGTLFVGNGMLTYGSETDKTSPVKHFPIQDVGVYTQDGKTLHIEMKDTARTVFDFQASSKSEAKAIFTKIRSSKEAATGAGATTTATTSTVSTLSDTYQPPLPATPLSSLSEQETEECQPPAGQDKPELELSTNEPRWAVALYPFTAAGHEETSMLENEQVPVLDCVSSDDWWTIQHQDGSTGIVPATYVQFQEEYEAATAAQEQTHQHQSETIIQKPDETETSTQQQKTEAEKKTQAQTEGKKQAQRENKTKSNVKETIQQAAKVQVPGTVVRNSPRRSEIPAPPPPTATATASTIRSLASVKPIQATHSPSSRFDLTKPANNPGTPDPSKVRTWVDRTGAFRVDAQFLSYSNGKIRLHKVNGVKIDVPVQNMCIADLDFIESETGQRLMQDTLEHASPTQGPKSQPSKEARANDHPWDWLAYFTKANIPEPASTHYAAAFQSNGLGEGDVDHLTHFKMKSLGMSEKHVQRIQRYIENGVPEPPSDDEAHSAQPMKGKKTVTFGGTSVIHEDNNAQADPIQDQISQDEKLARQLQEEYDREQSLSRNNAHGAGLHRRGTGRPVPSHAAPPGVDQTVMDKIKRQLSTEPLVPSPKPATPSTALPLPLPPRSNTVDTTNSATSASHAQTGFEDNAWTVRNTTTSAPNQNSFPQPSTSVPMNTIQSQAPQGLASEQQLPMPLPPRQQAMPTASQPNTIHPQPLPQWVASAQSPPSNLVHQRAMQFGGQVPHHSHSHAISPQHHYLQHQQQQQFSQQAFVHSHNPVASPIQPPVQPAPLQPVNNQIFSQNINTQQQTTRAHGGQPARNWANATPDNPFGHHNNVLQQRTPTGVPLAPQRPPSLNSSLQPVQVFASMVNHAPGHQQPQHTGFSGTMGQSVNPHDKYSVFKTVDTNAPGVFNQGQQQGFQDQQTTGFVQSQNNAPMNSFGNTAIPPHQQQYYNRW